MYIKVRNVGNQWFREDNGALVGENAKTYSNVFYGGKTPIIKSTAGTYVKPIYGKIDSQSKKFIPLCEGPLLNLCTKNFCEGYCSPICPIRKTSKSIGFYIYYPTK